MLSASDLRKGLKVQIDGNPYIVTDFEFSKPGKGQALYRTKMRNMISGNQLVKTYRSNDKFEKADLEERKMQFLYSQGDEYHFMDTASPPRCLLHSRRDFTFHYPTQPAAFNALDVRPASLAALF